MEKIGLFYASTTGNTEAVAEQIAGLIGGENVDLHDLAVEPVTSINGYACLIFGISTWDYGELQEDWEAIWEELKLLDFSGRRVALFGLGDQIGYGEWFVDAMGLLAELLQQRGAELVAPWSAEGYEFEESKALNEDRSQFVGLAIDEDAQSGETSERVERWVPEVLSAFGI
ncbi:flavodoxin FldB [Marinobacterium mangrovicola]|uniref:Flavodoxin n=1 Tax=Marinobacterium mangrovicola TaxID=1476959 RepID=A0A4R1GFJ1_9GAMM|nr:flavodoxin FldB [Marinobacterium mangrovicola]TCK05631.1 flavodoxin II [Marinobacterium mangrovicola]